MDEEIVDNQIVSVFDLLYKEYSQKLEKLNRSLLNRSKFKSENIMDTILNKEFSKEDYKDYQYEREILLRNMFKNLDNLSDKEKQIDILRFETGGESYEEEKIISSIRGKMIEI